MTDRSATDAHTRVTPLKGRRAVISGGSTGIGRAIAILLASEGVKVFIGGTDQEHLDAALQSIRAVGEGDGLALDLAVSGNVDGFMNAADAYLGGYDIVVPNAAVAASGLGEMARAALEHAIALNFSSYLLMCHIAAEKMRDHGDIVMIGSMSSYVLGPHSTVYAGIKYGLEGFSIALRRELGPKGIRVSLVEPGLTGSDMQEPDTPPEKQREMIAAETMLRAEDIAVGVHYLLTQPNRTVIQRLTISPRVKEEE